MWIESANKDIVVEDVNETLLKLTGELSDEEARIQLCKFLMYNLKFTTFLLTGVRLAPYQSLLIKSWFERSFCLNVITRGGAKCISYTPETKVITKKQGLISITELFKNVSFDKGEWINFEEIELWNGNSWQKTDKFLTQPLKPCLKIKTRYGYELEGSTNHLIKVLNPLTLDIAWRKYEDIKVGDYTCIARKNIEINSELEDIENSYFLGLILGDGCFAESNPKLSLTTADDEIIEYVSNYTKEINRITLDKRTENTRQIFFTHEFTKNFLEKYNLKRSLSYDKIIPDKIFKNNKNLASCLSGLFDTDGYILKGKGNIKYCTVSDKLIKQVHLGLLHFGIISSIKLKKTNSKFGRAWILTINGINVDKFIKYIGFRLKRKNNKEILIKKKNTNNDVIPGAKEICYSIYREHRKIKDEKNIGNRLDMYLDQINLSYNGLEENIKLFEKMGVSPEKLAKLKNIIYENFFFDPIVEINPFNHDCIDFNVPTGECYWTNGFISHNTFSAGIFALLYAIFNPGQTVLVVSATFRSSRRILEAIDNLSKSSGGALLQQVFKNEKGSITRMSKRGDQFTLSLANGSYISAVPLGNSDKLRGLRCQVLILDEALLIPQITIESILMPFLNAKANIAEKMSLMAVEDKLIRKGILKEEDRKVFPNTNKMIMLSSASYTFEYLYDLYKRYLDKIDKGEEPKKYFVSQISYEVVPEYLMDKDILKEMVDGTMSQALIDRELRAQFSSGSDGYFSMKKMRECTVTDGQYPISELTGNKGDQYILAIDPSFSSAENSDHFAMCLMKIMEKKSGKKIGLVVHQYAVAGGDLKDHIAYFHYLLTHFNIIWIAIDSSGGDANEFINSSVNSQLFKESKLDLYDIEADFRTEDLSKLPTEIRNSYNFQSKRIVQKQSFTSGFQKAANEYLQAVLDYGAIMFAGKIAAIENVTSLLANDKLPIIEEHNSFKDGSMFDFIEEQDKLMDMVKTELALIEISTTTTGHLSFDLPSSQRRSKKPNRTRKDNYSALLLCNWALKLYLESLDLKVEETPSTFTPFSC